MKKLPWMGAALCAALAVCGAPRMQAQFTPAGGGSAQSIPQSALVQPETLAQQIKAGGVARPLVLQVGSRVMFRQAHIAGAKYAGAGSQPEGLELLAATVAKVKKSAPIVLYCGCCPWNRCPNVSPAFEKLRALGFTNVKVLYIASNFGADWAQRGYAVESGE